MPSVLSPAQVERFSRDGYLALDAAFPATGMEGFLWRELRELHGIEQDDPQTWAVPGPWVGLSRGKQDSVFAPMASDRLIGAINDLLGHGCWPVPAQWGGFKVTFPDTERPWNVPTTGWHIDFHMTCEPIAQLAGIIVFTFLSEVPPRGGGTLIAPGSHHLVRKFVDDLSADELKLGYRKLMQRFNTSQPWLAELTGNAPSSDDRVQRFMKTETVVDGIPLRVAEFSGQPGDAIFMHPWMLHAIAPNGSNRPRFMRSKNIERVTARTQAGQSL